MALDLLGIDASRASAETMTGTEWYSREIIRAMAGIEDRPALRLYHRAPAESWDGVAVQDVVVERDRLWTHLGLDRELRQSAVDALFVPAHVLPRSHPPASVVTIHDLGYIHEPGAHTFRRRAVLDLTTRWNARRAQRIIVPSTATRDDLKHSYGINPDRVDVIPHGVDFDRFRPIEQSVVNRTLETLQIRPPYLLFLSTIQPRKNLGRIIAAFESPEFAELQLVVAGAAGWKSEALLDRMRMSTRSRDIRRLDYVEDEHVPALYNGASAFVFPSLFEGFGMGVLEAMACGCPVVTSSTSSLPEVAGDAAILVDPHSVEAIGNGIAEALEPQRSQALREAGLTRVAEFTWERAALQTLDTIRRAYEEVER